MIAANVWDSPVTTVPVRVVIADRGRLFRESLAEVLTLPGQIEVLAADQDDPTGLERLLGLQPDLVLISAEGADEALFSRLRCLRARAPGVRLLVLVTEVSSSDVVSCIEAGASGCLARGQSLAELRQALLRAAAGESVVPQKLAGTLIRRLSELGREQRKRERLDSLSLTARELEILQLLAEGRNNKDIAEHLCLSIHTVKNHIHRVLEALGVHSRWEAAKVAVSKGWVPDRRSAPRSEGWAAQGG